MQTVPTRFFELLRQESERHWERIALHPDLFGFQTQPGSSWQAGLSASQLADFETALGFALSPCIREFYRHMNGLDRPGINIYGSSGHPPAYAHRFYRYPDDLPAIQAKIDWICEANGVSRKALGSAEIPAIFPIIGHRFLILAPPYPALSMYGNDIISWADNLAELLCREVFAKPPASLAPFIGPQSSVPVPYWEAYL